MRFRFLIPLCCFAITCGFAASAYADELPAGIFHMANGSYYQPSTGITSTDLSVFVASSTTSTPAVVTPATTTPPIPPTPIASPILGAIERAQAYLRQHILTHPSADQGKTFSSEPDWRYVTLAIWNPKTDVIRYVSAKKKGTDLTQTSDSIAGISVARTNGINSQYSVKGGEMVVGVQYTIFDEQVISKKKKKYTGHDVVYTPYSSALHTPEMIAEGKRWLGETMKSVYADLRKDGVRSKAFPEKLLSDAIDPDLVLSIMLIEHIDEHALAKDAAREVEVMYVTLAANTEDSYDYSRSSAGALGLVQFIPSTYNAIAKWPDVHLNKSFEIGMRDPKNAIRAETAYLDYLLAHLPAEAKASYTAKPNLVSEYVAAAYNGGVSRVTKAMKAWDMNVDPSQRMHVLSRSRLKLETMKYVLKLRTLREALQESPTLVASTVVESAFDKT